MSKINLKKKFVILEKMDGSMIAPFYTKGKLRLQSSIIILTDRFGTKNGLTDTALIAEEYIASGKFSYQEFSQKWVDKGFTPIYEWCSQRSPIVLHVGSFNYESN